MTTIAHDMATLAQRLAGADAVIEAGVIDDPVNAPKLVRTEMGTAKMPARPSLSKAADETAGDVQRAIEAQLGVAVDGLSPSYEAAGQIVVDKTRAIIDARVPPPLADATMQSRRARGRTSDLPLRDSSDMYDALTVEVRRG